MKEPVFECNSVTHWCLSVWAPQSFMAQTRRYIRLLTQYLVQPDCFKSICNCSNHTYITWWQKHSERVRNLDKSHYTTCTAFYDSKRAHLKLTLRSRLMHLSGISKEQSIGRLHSECSGQSSNVYMNIWTHYSSSEISLLAPGTVQNHRQNTVSSLWST